jgi:hypothetical protein
MESETDNLVMSQVIFGNIVIVTLLCFIVAHTAISEMVQVTIARDTGCTKSTNFHYYSYILIVWVRDPR